MNWNTYVMSVQWGSGPLTPVPSALPAGAKSVTWAFATGECGTENWVGITPAQIADANVGLFADAGLGYVISTGGAGGIFTCGTDTGFETFLGRYASGSLAGVDFDIENGQTQAQVNALIQRVVAARTSHPNLRFSFTLPTLATSKPGSTTAVSLGTNATEPLDTEGQYVMNAIAAYGLTGYVIDLMVMDYGTAGADVCVVGPSGRCDMGQSAIQAAMNLHDHDGVPYGQIELTSMIGGNDITDEVFTLTDVDAIASFARSKGLAGLHFWSLDRDQDCSPGPASSTCNTYGTAGTLGFTKRFVADLGL
jgi:hypothetical protein